MTATELLVVVALWLLASVAWGALRPSPERLERKKREREEQKAVRRRARTRVTDEGRG